MERGPWHALHRVPIARAAVPFIAGLALADVLGADTTVAWALVLSTPAAALLLTMPADDAHRWRRGLALSIWFACLGAFWTTVRLPTHDPLHIARHPGEAVWSIAIRNVSSGSSGVFRADAEVMYRVAGDDHGTVHGPVLLTLLAGADDTLPRRGDRLLVEGALGPIDRVPDPGGFDRQAWAASRGIGHELFAPTGAWRVVDHKTHWTDMFHRARTAISNWIDGSALSVSERGVAKALVLGMRDELSREQVEAFARSGTIHLLAVSGMHVGLIYAAIRLLLGWMGAHRRAQIVRGVIVLAALWGYTGLTGSEPSVLRATVMFSMFTLSEMVGLRVDGVNSLAAAALVLLLWDPFMWRMIGFQLSFMAVLGILLFYRPVYGLFNPRNTILRHTWSLLAVSLVAQLTTTPLVLYHFQAFPTWFLPANLVVCAVGTAAIYGSIALIVLYKVPVVGTVLTHLLQWALRIMESSTAFFADAPAAYPAVRVDLIAMLLLSALIAAVTLWRMWGWIGMKWTTLAIVAALLVHWHVRTGERLERVGFVVYDDRRATRTAMTTGRELLVLDLGDEPGQLPMKVERHARTIGSDPPLAVDPSALHGQAPVAMSSTVLAAGRWTTPGMDVIFVSEDLAWPTGALRPDALVVHDIPASRPPEIPADAVVPQHVVLAAGLHWRVREQLRNWCATHGVPCHDVRDQGAFVLDRVRPHGPMPLEHRSLQASIACLP